MTTIGKPTYEELEKKCALQQSKLAAINELMSVVEKASDIAKAGIEELQSQNADLAVQLANAESKCRDLAAENSGLKSGQSFFMYSDETGFEIHKAQDAAIASAKDRSAVCREEAAQDGWPEDADTICWGVIMQKAIEMDFEKPSEQNGWIGWSEYKLSPDIETPATDAFLAEVRAQGVEALVLRRKTAARIARERDDLRAADDLEGEACRAQMFADDIRQEARLRKGVAL